MPDSKGPAEPRLWTPRYAKGSPVRRAGGRCRDDLAFEDLLDAFTTHLDQVKCLSFETQDSYAKVARGYYRWLVAAEPTVPLREASPAEIRAFVTFQRDQKISPGTIATYLQAIKSFYQFLLLDQPSMPNPTQGVRGPRVIPPPIDPFTEDELRQLLSFTQRYERSGDRRRWVGYVVLVIFASTGVRNGELRGLQTDHVNPSRRELRVMGKGSKERIIPFGAGAAEVLRTYAQELRPRLAASPYFIVNPASLHGPNQGRMGEVALTDLVRSLLTEAGISGRANPHRFRHSYATLTTSRTGNVELTRELLGHTDITTTSRYVHTAMKDRHLAAEGVDLVPMPSLTATAFWNNPQMPQPPTRPVNAAAGAGGTSPVTPPLGESVPIPASRQVPPAAGISARARPLGLEESPQQEDIRASAQATLADAVEIARRLPPQLLVHLNPERVVEVALSSLISGGLDTEPLLAAAAAVLSWAHGLRVPLDPLLATYGRDAALELLKVQRTLELLRGLDPTDP